MQAYKKKMKVKVGSNESIDYLQKNDLILIALGECTLRTDAISDSLQELDQLSVDLPRIIEANKHVQQLQQNVASLSSERDELQEKLSEKIKPVEKYESEINILNEEKETSIKSNAELTKQIETFKENIQSLQDKNQDLKDTIKELNKIDIDDQELDQIYDRLGTFKKIRNKLRIIELWEGNPQKVLRQIEILNLLEGQMGVGSIKQYIKEMIRGKLLSRTSIQGSYVLNLSGYCDFKLDCDKLCEKLLGSVYETGVQIRMEKIKSKRELEY